MGKRWARTPLQTLFLNAKLADYVQVRAGSNLELFRSKLNEEWFQHWPEHQIVFPEWKEGDAALSQDQMHILGKAIDKRQKQLYSYMRWHSGGKPVRTKNVSSMLTRYLHQSKASKQGRRRRTLLEIYSNLHYKTKLRVLVAQELKDTTPVTPETKKQHDARKMAIYQRLRAEHWQQESGDVQAEVQKIYDDQEDSDHDDSNSDRDNDSDSDDSNDDDDEEASEKKLLGRQQKCIDSIGDVIAAFCQDLCAATGWSATVIAGGLNKEGDIKVHTTCIGKSPAGASFQAFYPEFQSGVILPFWSFLRVRHPVAERHRRAALWAPENDGQPPSPLNDGQVPPLATYEPNQTPNTVSQITPTATPPALTSLNQPLNPVATAHEPHSMPPPQMTPITQPTAVMEKSIPANPILALNDARSNPANDTNHIVWPTNVMTPAVKMSELPSTDLSPLSGFLKQTDPLYTWTTNYELPALPATTDNFNFSYSAPTGLSNNGQTPSPAITVPAVAPPTNSAIDFSYSAPTGLLNNGQTPSPAITVPAVAPPTNSAIVSAVAAPNIPAATSAVAPLPTSASTMLPSNNFNFSYMGPSAPTGMRNNGRTPSPAITVPAVAPPTNSAIVAAVAAPNIPAAKSAVAPLPTSASTMLPSNNFNFSYMGPSAPTGMRNNSRTPSPAITVPAVAPPTNSAIVAAVAAPNIPAATSAVAPLPTFANTMRPSNDFNFFYMGPSTPTGLENNGQIPSPAITPLPMSANTMLPSNDFNFSYMGPSAPTGMWNNGQILSPTITIPAVPPPTNSAIISAMAAPTATSAVAPLPMSADALSAAFATPLPRNSAPPSGIPTPVNPVTTTSTAHDSVLASITTQVTNTLTDNLSAPQSANGSKKRKTFEEKNAHMVLPEGVQRARKNCKVAAGGGKRKPKK